MSEIGVYARQTWALTKRELKHWYRSKMQIFMALIQPLIWLGLFGFAMSGFVNTSMTGVDYFSFLSIGMIVMTALTTAMTSGMSLIWDRRFGFLDKLRATPIPRSIIPLARVLSTTIKSIVQTMIVFVIALVLGLHLGSNFDVVSILVMLAVVICVSMTFSSIFVAMGLVIKSQEVLMGLNMLLNLPLMMASGIMFPTSAFPNWLKAIANVNPLTYAADAIRRVTINVPDTMISLPQLMVSQDVLIIVVVAIIVTLLGMVFARKGTKG